MLCINLMDSFLPISFDDSKHETNYLVNFNNRTPTPITTFFRTPLTLRMVKPIDLPLVSQLLLWEFSTSSQHKDNIIETHLPAFISRNSVKPKKLLILSLFKFFCPITHTILLPQLSFDNNSKIFCIKDHLYFLFLVFTIEEVTI